MVNDRYSSLLEKVKFLDIDNKYSYYINRSIEFHKPSVEFSVLYNYANVLLDAIENKTPLNRNSYKNMYSVYYDKQDEIDILCLFGVIVEIYEHNIDRVWY